MIFFVFYIPSKQQKGHTALDVAVKKEILDYIRNDQKEKSIENKSQNKF